jgi:hypothetical protein
LSQDTPHHQRQLGISASSGSVGVVQNGGARPSGIQKGERGV